MAIFTSSDYNAPPQAGHVEAFLRGATYWPTDPNKQELARYEAQLMVDAALSEFEGITGYVPFQGDVNNPSTRTFYVDSRAFSQTGIVPLDGGLIRYDSATINGQAAGGYPAKFIAKPDNANAKNQPIQWLWLPTHRYWRNLAEYPVKVEVTGVWGYCDQFPPVAFQAIVQRAAVNLLRQIENLQSIANISQDGFEKSFDVVGILTQKDVAQGGDKDFVTIAERFQSKVFR